jgi:hypothetical protein
VFVVCNEVRALLVVGRLISTVGYSCMHRLW